jgi:integrase
MPRQPRPWYRAQTDWWMVQVGGQQQKLVKGKGSRRAAQKKFHELMLEREKNPAPTSGEPTVASIIETYLGHAARHLGAETLYQRQLYLQGFAEVHGWRHIHDCLPFHLTSWLESHAEWKSDWTWNAAIKAVQRPFNWAATQRLITANPFRGISHRCGQPRRPVTDQEFQKLLRATAGQKSRKRPSPGARFRQVLIFLRFTGCRPKELCQLEWSNVDLDGGVIVLQTHKTTRTQRTPRPRIIALDPVVVKLLLHLKRRAEPGSRVFLTYRKTPWTRHNLGLRIRRARKKAGVPDDAKLYGVRHGFGTRAIVNGVDLKTLAELMGHTTTRMTEHYVHLAGQRQHLADAMRVANARRPSA